MASQKQFECLRCEHHFLVDYDSRKVVERSCPKCSSNSVRPESAARPVAGKQEVKAG